MTQLLFFRGFWSDPNEWDDDALWNDGNWIAEASPRAASSVSAAARGSSGALTAPVLPSPDTLSAPPL